jgi:hypothetical protein
MPAASIHRFFPRRLIIASAAAVALTAIVAVRMNASAGPGAPRFGAAVRLPGGQGGEPSLAVDTSPLKSRGNIYVVAIGDANGPLEWYSYDGGRTFSKPVPFDVNGPLRGGDSDVAVNSHGYVIAADLDVSHASVQISTDHGKSFDAGTETAPEDDRPWITPHGQQVYVSYHDFVAEAPVVCISHDRGRTFTTCNQAFSPSDPQSASACAENTVPARALTVDPVNHALSFMYSCSTQAENAQHPPYGPLHDYYLAQSTDGGTTWTTYPVFLADTSGGKTPNYSNIFSTLRVDSKGNLYALFAGTADDANPKQNPYHVYLEVSKDHGHTWSTPVQVDHDSGGEGTHVLADMAVTTPGNVDFIWYGTSATGEPNGVCGTIVSQSPCKDGLPNYDAKNAPAWHVFMAQSTDTLSSHPSFTEVEVNTAATHFGRICTNGLVCGSSDRTLLDFITVGIDCHGLAHVTYGANTKAQEKAGKTFVWVSNQVGGSRIAPPAACSLHR